MPRRARPMVTRIRNQRGANPLRIGARWALSVVLAVLFGACTRNPQAEKARYAANGDHFLAQGKAAEAIIEYRNAVQQDPRDGEIRLKLAETQVKVGDLANAAQEYVRAADLLPANVTVQIKAGNLLLLGGRFDDAKVRAEKALEQDARNVEAQILLANSLAGLKQLDAAVTEMEAAVRLNADRSMTYTSLGALEMRRGRSEAAARAFEKAVALDERSVAARLSLGNFYWLTQRPDDANRELEQAVALEPNNPLAHRVLATFYLVTKRAAAAEPHLKRLVELTKSTDASLALADFYVAVKNEAAARHVLEPLANAPGTAALANVRLAALDHGNRLPQEAYRRLDGILATDPTNLQALLAKSAFSLQDGKLDDAFASATDAVRAHDGSAAAFYALGQVQARRNQQDAAISAYQEVLRLNPRAGGAKLALARLQLSTGRTEASVGLAEDALKIAPDSGDARLVLVQALIARGELARAESHLTPLMARFPKSAAVHTQMGLLAGRKGNSAAARHEFEQALAIDPNATEALGGLIAVDLSNRRIDDARARVEARVREPNVSPAVLMLAGRTYAATGDLKTAEQLFRRVATADPSNLHAYGALGQLYAKQGRLDAALKEFETIAARDPKPVPALTLAGMMLESQGNIDAARQRFERVMQLDPEAAVAANNLAWIYAEHGGNLDMALQLAQTAKHALPDMPEVNDTLGFVYYKKNMPALAIAPLQSSIQKDGNNPVYHYHLGQAYAKMGDTARAQQSLNRALMLKPDFPGAVDARGILATLGAKK